MNIARFLNEDRIDLDLDGAFDEDNPATYERVTGHMCSLLETSEQIVNPTKLRLDLINREKRAPSWLGDGVVLPHVRTLQARRLVMAVAISRSGLDLEAPDDEPVRLVVALVGPPYDDKQYLQIYKRLADRLRDDGGIATVTDAQAPGEVVRALSS